MLLMQKFHEGAKDESLLEEALLVFFALIVSIDDL